MLLTLSQSLLGAILLINMELAWWEAAGLFLLFIVQLGFARLHVYITWIDFAWCGVELLRLIRRRTQDGCVPPFPRGTVAAREMNARGY